MFRFQLVLFCNQIFHSGKPYLETWFLGHMTSWPEMEVCLLFLSQRRWVSVSCYLSVMFESWEDMAADSIPGRISATAEEEKLWEYLLLPNPLGPLLPQQNTHLLLLMSWSLSQAFYFLFRVYIFVYIWGGIKLSSLICNILTSSW